MQSYDIAHEGIVWIALDQKRFQRFTDRAHRMIASRSAAAAKIMHRDVEGLPTGVIESPEHRIGKALDGWKLRAKEVEVTLARNPCRHVAVLNQGLNGDRPRPLSLFVERFALRRTRISQDTAPVYRRR